jgi:hypothetical protein
MNIFVGPGLPLMPGGLLAFVRTSNRPKQRRVGHETNHLSRAKRCPPRGFYRIKNTFSGEAQPHYSLTEGGRSKLVLKINCNYGLPPCVPLQPCPSMRPSLKPMVTSILEFLNLSQP